MKSLRNLWFPNASRLTELKCQVSKSLEILKLPNFYCKYLGGNPKKMSIFLGRSAVTATNNNQKSRILDFQFTLWKQTNKFIQWHNERKYIYAQTSHYTNA